MSGVRFIESTHQYISDVGELISVSAFTKNFEQKKDWKAIAKKKVKKLQGEGTVISVEELMQQWDLKRQLGSEAGTLVHKKKEDDLLALGGNIKAPRIEGGIKWALPIDQLENNSIYPELMIYDFEHMVCGQSDEVRIENGVINVYDTKTDKEISWHAYSSDWVQPEKLLAPLGHLDACNGNIYSIKMSLYMFLIWKANRGRFKPGKLILNWCPIVRDADGIPILKDGQPQIIKEEAVEVPYRKREVMAMLATRKTNS